MISFLILLKKIKFHLYGSRRGWVLMCWQDVFAIVQNTMRGFPVGVFIG